MGQDVDDFDGALVGSIEIREIVTHGLVDIEQTILIEFHDGQSGSEDLSQRGDVVHILGNHLRTTAIGKRTETLVIHRFTIFHHQDLASRICGVLNAHSGH